MLSTPMTQVGISNFNVWRCLATRGLHLLRVLALLEGEVWPCTFLPQQFFPEDLCVRQIP